MKTEQYEKAKKHLTRPGGKNLKDSPIAKKDIEKTIATFGNPKSKGKWAEFVKKNKKLDDKEIQDKEFWEAYNDPKKMLKYVSKYGDTEIKDPYPRELEKFAIENSSVKNPNFPLKGNTKTKNKKDKKEKWTYESWADGLEERTRPVKTPPVKIVKKPKPVKPLTPLEPLYDWRFAPWWLYPEDDDVKPEEDKTRIRKKLKTGITQLI